MSKIGFGAFVLATALLAATAVACETDPRVDAVAAAWLQHRSQQPLDDLTLADALCFRTKLMERLAKPLGSVVGYKVSVYTPAARKDYGASAAAIGVLRQKMLFEEGATVSARAGVALVSEADFVLVVKSSGINAARTREQVYRHLRGFRPFVEVPDLNYAAPVKPSLGQLVALDANARLGVLGKEVALPQTPEGLQGLTELAAEVTVAGAADGEHRARGVARETLGDPLDIVIAARDVLRQEGVLLQPGDLISIGALTPPRPVKAGETLSIRYRVAPAIADLSVKFVP